ncbi:MAG: N-acetylglucosamine-6-phosphate deacetylase [Lachnospiraceae bacterium]|nr:N-acetylglucosamine-6-phosphate deacetylase [Lachnospiraceae bacterium]
MRIVNANLFTDGAFRMGSIEFDTKITGLGPADLPGDLDAGGDYVIPGLIDIHTHGAVGEDASDGRPEGLNAMSRYYAARGVTSWCPTTMTLKEPELKKAVETIRDFRRPENGAKIAGMNLEGPFLCHAKRGAQAAENLHAPDIAMFRRLNAASGGQIRLVTVACEEPGALDFIRAASKECTVSLGHTTAVYDTAMAACDAGASHITHLFNAMPGLHHRSPGVIGAAADAGTTVELICDGLHIHPAVIRMTYQMFGPKLAMISDSLRCAGMPDGNYTLGGQPITMKEGRAVLAGTDTLAGSSIHLMDALRRTVSFGIPLEAAVASVTGIPAHVIRREKEIGTLQVGACADLCILDPELNLKAVFIDGNRRTSL